MAPGLPTALAARTRVAEMTALAWQRRPFEERTSLNPAFLALTIRSSADGYCGETNDALPVALAFLAAPLALHRTTRDSLPSIISTSMAIWLQDHPFLREGFPDRI